MNISENDKSILRSLAEEQAKIAELPINKNKAEMWRRLNEMNPERPMLWINEIPWHEMNVNDELTLKCEDEFCRSIEDNFRKRLYQWRHMRGDMIVESVFRHSIVMHDSGFGIEENTHTEKIDENGVVSRDFIPQIKDFKDVEKIKMPGISIDEEATEEQFQALNDAFGDILKIEKYGRGHIWFTIWDYLIRWYGVEEAMMDLILKPELIHASVERVLNAFLCRLEQYEKLNVLELNNGNFRIGSGGLGYTDILPQKDFNPEKVRTIDQWGCSNAQIFSEVSPEMHEEFSLQYERKWLEKFGATYYGCCEPLHNKLEILSSIPNLKKISVSPQANIEKTVEKAGGKYVLSIKPNPAILAPDKWSREAAERDIQRIMEQTRGCSVEVIMKDISTVRYDPKRLWEWVETAQTLIEGS